MDKQRILEVPEYTVEIWQWNYGGWYVADISNIITDGLNFSWVLNGVETLDFSIDLVQFERKCKMMGVTPADVLTPYVHDIRIRRNGKYILGCQVVETNIDIPNDANVTIQVRCTGFLNLFKDRYLTYPFWSDKSNFDFSSEWVDASTIAISTAPYVAGRMVEMTQQNTAPVGIVKNPTADIDRDGWIAVNGFMEGEVRWPHSGNGHVRIYRGDNGLLTAATKLYVPRGTRLTVSVWVRGQDYQTLKFMHRQYVNQSETNETSNFGYVSMYDRFGYFIESRPAYNCFTMRHYQRYDFTITTQWDNEYLLFEQNKTGADAMWIDDLMVCYADESLYRNFYVTPHYNTIYSGTYYTSQVLKRNYQMQNIKDALVELTELDIYPIEFYFTPDRHMYIGYGPDSLYPTRFHTGDNNYDLEICYPGNIESMTINRSASNLYNSILNIGSGIGNERVEAQVLSPESQAKYGCRETVVTSNNASEESRLREEAFGVLDVVKDHTNLPKVVIRDGSVNPNNLKIGDRIRVYINNDDEYLDTISGPYRVVEYQVSVDLENVETVTLTLKKIG